MSEPKSWNDLASGQPAPPKEDRIAELCAEVFTSPAGKELLAALRRKHFETGNNPLAHDHALRVRATYQHFIHEIEAARDRGLTAAKK